MIARCGIGAANLARSYGAWLVGDGPAAGCKRALGSALGALFAALFFQGTPWLVFVALVGSVLGAHYAGRPAEPEAGDEPEDGIGLDEFVDLVREESDGRGVLLTKIAAALECERPGEAWSTKDVRALLAEADIRVREGVRTPAGNGPGVHREDVPPLSPDDEAALVGDVVAGQNANTNANNTTTVTPLGQSGYSVLTADERETRYTARPSK